jgi:ABC-type branched-subunit amino acid transport system substrate-binding protein
MEVVLEQARAEDWTVHGRHLGVRHVDAAPDARAEAVRLLAVNGVTGLVVGPGVAGAEEAAASARAHGAAVVILDEVAGAPVGPAVKLLGPDPARRGRALAGLARKTLKKKRVAVVIDRGSAVCAALANAFTEAWRPGGEVREWPADDALNRPGALAERKEFAPDVMLAAVPAGRLANIDWAPGVPVLYGGPDVDEGVLRRAAWPEKTEVYAATLYTAAAELSAAGQAWRTAYEKAANEPADRAAVLGSDGLRLMMEGLTRAQGGLRERLRHALAGVKEFEAVTGKVTWKDGMAVRPLFVVRVAGGKVKLLEAVREAP